jgi:flagellar basal-body rod protein FlgB
MYRKPLQPSADGNTVDMDVERVQFADNAVRYEASVRFVSDQVKEMLAAIQDR